MWFCVPLYHKVDGYRGFDTLIEKWLNEHMAVRSQDTPTVKFTVMENNGRKPFSTLSNDSPEAYVYLNDAAASVMFKLAMGGRELAQTA
jgi:hypothetical protein